MGRLRRDLRRRIFIRHRREASTISAPRDGRSGVFFAFSHGTRRWSQRPCVFGNVHGVLAGKAKGLKLMKEIVSVID